MLSIYWYIQLVGTEQATKHSNIDNFNQFCLCFTFCLKHSVFRVAFFCGVKAVLFFNTQISFVRIFIGDTNLQQKESFTQRHMHQNDPTIKADKRKKNLPFNVLQSYRVLSVSVKSRPIQLNLLLKPDKVELEI